MVQDSTRRSFSIIVFMVFRRVVFSRNRNDYSSTTKNVVFRFYFVLCTSECHLLSKMSRFECCVFVFLYQMFIKMVLHVCFFYLIIDACCIEITFLHPKQLERIARSLLVHYDQFVTTTFTCSAVAFLAGVCLCFFSLLFGALIFF